MGERISIEVTMDTSTPLDSLPLHISAELWRYAKTFLEISRPSLHFMWRDGEHWLDVHLVRRDTGARGASATPQASVRISSVEMPRGITTREFDVLTLVALGLTNGGIAERLGTSARTVSTQIERLLDKLEQSTRGGLAALAVDAGLLRLPLPGGVPIAGGIGVAELELVHRQGVRAVFTPVRDFVSGRAPIRLGMIIPEGEGVHGDALQMMHGAQLAIDEINEQGGLGDRYIELVKAPVSFFEWDSVHAGLEQLFDAEVDAIITSYISAEHPEFMEVAASYGRPFLHTATFDLDVMRAESEPFRFSTIFQTCASETYYAPGMLRFVTQLETEGVWRPRSRKVVSIEQSSESMQLGTEAFRAEAQSQGWTVAPSVVTRVGETNWDRIIADIVCEDPDVIMVSNYLVEELIAFQEALLRAPVNALVYCIYGPSVPLFIERLGAKADGIIWATTTGTYDDELGRRFRRRFQSRFGADPGWSQAGAAYDQVRILAAAWTSADARNVKDVIHYIRRWPHRGVNGVYYFGETGHAPQLYPDTTADAALSQAHLVYQIQGNEHVLLAPQPFGAIEHFRTPHWVSTEISGTLGAQ